LSIVRNTTFYSVVPTSCIRSYYTFNDPTFLDNFNIVSWDWDRICIAQPESYGGRCPIIAQFSSFETANGFLNYYAPFSIERGPRLGGEQLMLSTLNYQPTSFYPSTYGCQAFYKFVPLGPSNIEQCPSNSTPTRKNVCHDASEVYKPISLPVFSWLTGVFRQLESLSTTVVSLVITAIGSALRELVHYFVSILRATHLYYDVLATLLFSPVVVLLYDYTAALSLVAISIVFVLVIHVPYTLVISILFILSILVAYYIVYDGYRSKAKTSQGFNSNPNSGSKTRDRYGGTTSDDD
jgi:hypothetical protein